VNGRVGLCAMLLAIGVALPDHALAQEAGEAPSAEDRAEAERLTLAGNRAHQTGDFEQAIALYHQALVIAPVPELHYNLGQAYRFSKKPREALAAYERYLELDPDGRVSANARRFAEILRVEIAKIAAPETPVVKEKVDVEPAKPLENPIVAPPPVHNVDRETGSRSLRLSGIAIGAVGVVGLGAGSYFGLRARSLSDELSETDRERWTTADIENFEDGESAERNAIVFGVAGGVLVAGGIALYLVGREGGEIDQPAPLVSIGRDSVNVAISGSF